MTAGVDINPNVLADEPSIVGELVASAINDANKKLETMKQESMGNLTQGLNLPRDLNFRFHECFAAFTRS